MTAKIDRIGHRYGRLVVLKEGPPRTHPGGCVSLHWLCRCDCGKEKLVSGKALATGLTVSCGCWSAEGAAKRLTIHGGSKTAEYRTWTGMLDRCLNPKNSGFKDYGGRGITVSPEWRNSFSAFLSHIGRRPKGSYSVDRINNNKGYEPGNVRWATPAVQANNKRRSAVKTKCLRGHEFTADNTYIQKKTGHRFCKVCRLIRESRRAPRESRKGGKKMFIKKVEGGKLQITGKAAGPEVLAEIGHRIGPDEAAIVVPTAALEAALMLNGNGEVQIAETQEDSDGQVG